MRDLQQLGKVYSSCELASATPFLTIQPNLGILCVKLNAMYMKEISPGASLILFHYWTTLLADLYGQPI